MLPHTSSNMDLPLAKVVKENTTHDTLLDAGVEIDKQATNKLKLAADGQTVLVPQPRDNLDDALNWPSRN